MRFGSSMLTLGALVRGLSTFPAYEERMGPHTKFWITFSGQVITAIGHPFLITMSTKVRTFFLARPGRRNVSSLRSARAGSQRRRGFSPRPPWLEPQPSAGWSAQCWLL